MPTLSAHPSFSPSIKRTTQAKSIDHVQPSQSQGAGSFNRFLIFQHVNHHRRRYRVVCTSFDIALDCVSKQAAAESRFEGFLGRDDDDGNDARRCLRRCIKLQYIYIEKIFPGFSIWNIKKTFSHPRYSRVAALPIVKCVLGSRKHRQGGFCVFKERMVLRSF